MIPPEIDEDEDELRALARPTLPPVYSSIAGLALAHPPQWEADVGGGDIVH